MTLRARETIVVCGPSTGHTDEVVVMLGDEGWDVTRCTGDEALLESVCEHRPRAIIYALAHQLAVDLAMLALLRRVAPDLPVVVVESAERSIRAGRSDAVRPVILEESPADRIRLLDALRAALRRPRRRAPKLVEATG